jgi:prepilin-type N-terminal cleavage/methylation domain-containing protein
MTVSGSRENVCRKHGGAYFLDIPNHSRHGMSGFTLIEIMVVLLICLGLVTLMTTLYQSVGKSAIALRGGQQEWNAQQQMREQLLHLFNIPSNVSLPVAGQSSELYLASWQGGADASSGKPVLGYYHYAADERTLYYQENPLPAWWQDKAPAFNPSQLQLDVRAMPSKKVLTGVDSLAFVYLKKGAADMSLKYWERDWKDPAAPVLIQLQFTKAGRNYTIWFETRATDV